MTMDEKEAIAKEAIAHCLQGKLEAFKFIVEAYGNQMMALALSLLQNRQDAEDVC
ncbi:MAG: hypothetical protein N3B16_04520 [Candidatus Aminicenantes bacterium]|nr:hypothetical protein [Candidatus Aminicenantes bacterium]